MPLLLSPAKINVGLFVIGRRPDGFHNLDTLFARLALFDRIEIEPAPNLEVTCRPIGPQGAENLVFQALRRLAEVLGRPFRFRVAIEKRVPIGAGLGGGSANVATVLAWLVETGRVPAPVARRVAREMGADVAFFLEGGSWARGRGRGDELEPLAGMPLGVPVLVVVPPYGVSTARAYAALARAASYTPPEEARARMETLISALKQRDWKRAHRALANDFEPVVFRWHPELRELKMHLRRAGAALAGLSGSGAALYGLFPDGIPEALPLPEGFRSLATEIGPAEQHEGG